MKSILGLYFSKSKTFTLNYICFSSPFQHYTEIMQAHTATRKG